MRIAMIGLGDIARKAYLPVLAQVPEIDLHLCTRDKETLDRLGAEHRIAATHTSVPEVIEAGVEAALVHAATGAHPEIVEQLLDAGVHVYVDKPIADNLADATRLVRRARAAGLSLMTGFNRRHAPGYTALLGLPRDLVILQKNRAALADEPRRVVFDDFIHVADTLRFLAPGEVTQTRIQTKVAGGLLEHVILELSGDGFTAIGMMNRMSGAAEETCEVMGGGGKRRVVNLGDVIDYEPAGERLTRRGDWIPVGRQRGIEQICLAFLAAVREGRVIDGGDALATHALCEEIVAAC